MLSLTNQTRMDGGGDVSNLLVAEQSLVIRSDRAIRMIGSPLSENRLVEHENGMIEVIPKHPAYIFGEYVVRPALDVTFRLTMKSWSLVSSAASAFDSMMTNLFNPFLSAAAFEIEIDYDFEYAQYYQDESTADWPLHQAVMSGDLARVNQLIRFYGINQRDIESFSPIERSVLTNHKEIFEYLLNRGADLFSKDPRPSTSSCEAFSAVSLVIKGGYMDFFDLMVERYPVPSDILEYRMQGVGNLLHVAVKYGHANTLSYLLTKYHTSFQAIINEKNDEGYAPLHLAAILDDVESILVLVGQEANINVEDNNHHTPLHFAASKKHSEAVEYLILLGAKTDFTKSSPYELVEGNDFASERTRNVIRNLSDMRRMNALAPPDFSFIPPKNLVFQGGGVKGLAYVGVIRALEKGGRIKNVERIAGTSAGAITATFLALGMSADDIEITMREKSWIEFFDAPVITDGQTIIEEGGKIIGAIRRLIEGRALEASSDMFVSGKKFVRSTLSMWSRFSNLFSSPTPPGIAKAAAKQLWHFDGLCVGEDFRKWIESKISNATGIENCTFGELKTKVINSKQSNGDHKFKDLYVYGTNIVGDLSTTCFNTEDPKWERMIISDAVRISMSIPGVFKPHSPWFKKLDGSRVEQKEELGVFVDGGLINNFPLETFDQRRYVDSELKGEIRNEPIYNRRTLGFSIVSEEKAVDYSGSPSNIKDLLEGVVSVYFDAEQVIRGQMTFNKHRVVNVNDCGIGTLNIGLSETQLSCLVQSGEDSTTTFFRGHGAIQQANLNLFLLPRTFESLPSFISTKNKEVLFDLEKKVKDPDHPTILIDQSERSTKAVLIELAYNAAQVESGYKIVFWINGETQEAWQQGIKRLADGLKLNSNELDFDRLVFKIRKKLNEESYFQPWLILIDRFNHDPSDEEKRLLLQTRGGNVIFSSDLKKEESCDLTKKGAWWERYLTEGLVSLIAPSDDSISASMSMPVELDIEGLRKSLLVPTRFFGKKEWGLCFGDVGEMPPLPSNIEEILRSPCPFWEGKLVAETHMVVLIPTTVNGQPYTLDLLEQLIQHPEREGRKAAYRSYPGSGNWREHLGGKSVEKSYWGLMTRDPLPGSTMKTPEEQEVFLTTISELKGMKGRMPTTMEVITSIMLEYVRTGFRLYGNEPRTVTRCRDVVNNKTMVVGGFSNVSLDIHPGSGLRYDCDGVACFWEL